MAQDMDTKRDQLKKQVLRLIPPLPHKLNLNNGPRFARDIKNVFKQHVKTTTLSSGFFQDILNSGPIYRQGHYGKFLVQAQSVNSNEPLGTYMFMFKPSSNTGKMDTILTPISLFKIAELDGEVSEHVHRIASVWYGRESGLNELVPEFGQFVEDCRLHKHLVPIGPLVSHINSSFVTRVTSVLKGNVIIQTPPQNVSLLLPADLHINLDDSFPPVASHISTGSILPLYACLVYLMSNNQIKAHLYFCESGKGQVELFSTIKEYFTREVINRMNQQYADLYINRLTFGVICRIGFCGPSRGDSKRTLQFKGNKLPVLEFPDFVSDPGQWKQFL